MYNILIIMVIMEENIVQQIQIIGMKLVNIIYLVMQADIVIIQNIGVQVKMIK